MIIKICNISLLPWICESYTYSESWVRWQEYKSNNSVRLKYNKFGGYWSPYFYGDLSYLREVFDTHFEFGKYKFKHHQLAMDQIDKFLIRMGKLTIFL